MILSVFTKDRLIDENTAKDNLVSLMLRISKGEEVKDLMEDYISSFFTYSYLGKEKEGKSLDGLTYHQVDRRDLDAVGYSMSNNVYINERIYSKTFKRNDSATLLDAIFHETQHCSDNMNPTKATNSNYTPYFAGGLNFEMLDELNEMFEVAGSSFNFLYEVDDDFIDRNMKNIYDYSFGVYLNSPNEKRARDFAQISTLDIIDHGMERISNFKDKALLSKIAKSYDKLTSADKKCEQDLGNLTLTKEAENTMASLQVYLYKNLIDLNEEKSLFNREEDSDQIEKIDDEIAHKSSILAHTLNFQYEERVASKLIDFTLNRLKDDNETNLQEFDRIISIAPFKLSDNIMERYAHIYQERYDKEQCKKENITPLSLFVFNLDDTFENSYLLDIYSRNNPDFVYDLNHVNNSNLVTIPKEDIDDALERYNSLNENSFDENPDSDSANLE